MCSQVSSVSSTWVSASMTGMSKPPVKLLAILPSRRVWIECLPSKRRRNTVARNAELSPGLQSFLKEAAHGDLATLMPDGSPQVTHVWLDTDGKHILVNTGANHQK